MGIYYTTTTCSPVGSWQRAHEQLKCHVRWISAVLWWFPTCGVVYRVHTSSPTSKIQVN